MNMNLNYNPAIAAALQQYQMGLVPAAQIGQHLAYDPRLPMLVGYPEAMAAVTGTPNIQGRPPQQFPVPVRPATTFPPNGNPGTVPQPPGGQWPVPYGQPCYPAPQYCPPAPMSWQQPGQCGCQPGGAPNFGYPRDQASLFQQMAALYAQMSVGQATPEMVAKSARTQIIAGGPQIPLSFGTSLTTEEVINPNTSRTFTVTSSVPICLARFEIPRSITSFYLITSAKIARLELLADAYGVHADAFASDGVRTPNLEFPQLLPGQELNVIVYNIDSAPHPFYGTFWGTPLGGATPCG